MELFDLSGRVAVVTGGNGGIGLGMALGMARAGATIVVAGRDAAKNAAAVKQIQEAGAKASAIPVDVLKEESLPRPDRRHGEGARPPRHPGQQCRHEHPQAARAVHARRMAHGDGQQPHQRLPVQPCRLSRDEEGRHGQDHQHRLDDVDLRRALRHRLCREQGRHGADDQVDGHRLGQGQHPGERHPAGLDRHRADPARPRADPGPARHRCCGARRPAAGACPTTSPASRCSWPRRRPIS